MSQFLDHVYIEATSGDGGRGIVAWRREKYEPMGGPAGGNGGRGGHIYIQATNDLNTLIDFRFKKKFEADSGQRGGPKGMHGKNAKDLTLRVPTGTLIRDAETGEVVGDLVRPGQRIMVAQGGQGGRGNATMATPARRAPHFCEPGQPGIVRQLELELKVIADVGVIGLPNAGKSTLLSVVSAAKPKIAAYPFSTLEPNLGVVRTPDGERAFVMADIPGLVEGASQGVGLGHDFLRHVERTRLLIHLADLSSETLQQDIETIDNELKLYSEYLDSLPQILVLNKSDIVTPEQIKEASKQLAKGKTAQRHSPPVVISAATRQGITELLNDVISRLDKLRPQEEEPEIEELPPDERASLRVESGFEVVRKKGVFTVHGDRVERVVAVTDMRDPEALHHLHNVLRSMGVIDALIKEGCQQGADVNIGVVSFTFGEEWSG
ncbi:MAG TPA: GTPase ObgE [Planktothrix sp.]|jgi:GTP-binding protein